MTIYADTSRPGKWIWERKVEGSRKRTRFNSRQEALDAQGDDLSVRGVEYKPSTLREAIRVLKPQIWRGMSWERHARQHLAFVEGVLGDMPLDDLGRDAVMRVVDALHARNYAAATRNRYIASFRRFLGECTLRGYMLGLPSFQRVRAKEQERERYLDPREEAQLLKLFEKWDKPEIADFVIVGIDTGVRLSEGLSILPEHLKFPSGASLPDRLYIPKTKNGRARTISLVDRTAFVLARRARWARPGTPLFSLKAGTFRYWWNRARDAMGLAEDKDFTPHAMRHTCLTRLSQCGTVNIRVVQAWAGHSNIQTTARYTHVGGEDFKAAAKALEGRRKD